MRKNHQSLFLKVISLLDLNKRKSLHGGTLAEHRRNSIFRNRTQEERNKLIQDSISKPSLARKPKKFEKLLQVEQVRKLHKSSSSRPVSGFLKIPQPLIEAPKQALTPVRVKDFDKPHEFCRFPK